MRGPSVQRRPGPTGPVGGYEAGMRGQGCNTIRSPKVTDASRRSDGYAQKTAKGSTPGDPQVLWSHVPEQGKTGLPRPRRNTGSSTPGGEPAKTGTQRTCRTHSEPTARPADRQREVSKGRSSGRMRNGGRKPRLNEETGNSAATKARTVRRPEWDAKVHRIGGGQAL